MYFTDSDCKTPNKRLRSLEMQSCWYCIKLWSAVNISQSICSHDVPAATNIRDYCFPPLLLSSLLPATTRK